MTHKVARNTREILNKQEAISVLLEISQCFMAQMTGITAGFQIYKCSTQDLVKY